MSELKKLQSTITWKDKVMRAAVPELVQPLCAMLKAKGGLVVKDISFTSLVVGYKVNANHERRTQEDIGMFVNGFIKAMNLYKR